MMRIRTPRKLGYVGYGKRKDKDGRELPPRYPAGLFITTGAGSWYVEDLATLPALVSERSNTPQQLNLFELEEAV